jgi:hypothetical protein
VNPDILIPVLLIIATLLISGVGIEMANNPPTSRKAKWVYRVIFAVLGLTLCGLAYLQADRAATQQAQARTEAHTTEVSNAREMGILRGELTNTENLMKEAMAAFSTRTTDPAVKKLADSYALLAQPPDKNAVPSKAEALQPSAPIPPTKVLSPTNLELKKSAENIAQDILRVRRNYSEDSRNVEMGHMRALRNRANVSKFNADKENDNYNHERTEIQIRRAKDLEPFIAKASELANTMLTRLPPATASGIRALLDRSKPGGDERDQQAIQDLRTIATLLP